MEPSLLTSSNSGCHAVDGSGSPPTTGRVASTPSSRAMPMVGGRGWPRDEGLERVRALAREIDLRVAVAGQVVARDAHAPQPQQGPAVGRGVGPRRHPRLEPPQLLPADRLAVVMAVVADPEVPAARSVPVAEEHRERAEAGRQRRRRRVPGAGRRRPDHLVVRASPGAVGQRLDVLAERHRRQRRRSLPGRAEGLGVAGREVGPPTSRSPARSGSRRGPAAASTRRFAAPRGRRSRRCRCRADTPRSPPSGPSSATRPA